MKTSTVGPILYDVKAYGVTIFANATAPNADYWTIAGYSYSDCRFHMEDYSLDALTARLAVIARLYKAAKVATSERLPYKALETALQSIGSQVCLDPRTNTLHTRETLPAAHIHEYIDDSDKLGTRYNRYSVLADSISAAQRAILAKSATNGASADWITNFVNAGMPVLPAANGTYDDAPKWREWGF